MNKKEVLENLVDQLLSALQEIIASGEVLSDEFQGLIAQELQATLGQINNIKAEEGDIDAIERVQKKVADQVAPTPERVEELPAPEVQIPELEGAPHESSNINAFRYDPKSEQLYVKFQGKYPQNNGPVYKYEGIPKFIYDVFSRGAVGPKTSGRNAWHRWKEGVTPSHGAAMFALIKQGGYAYQRMS